MWRYNICYVSILSPIVAYILGLFTVKSDNRSGITGSDIIEKCFEWVVIVFIRNECVLFLTPLVAYVQCIRTTLGSILIWSELADVRICFESVKFYFEQTSTDISLIIT